MLGASINVLGIFPEYLGGVIRRDNASDYKTAALLINFLSNIIADVDCVMTIEILPNKVERLISLIFNTYLETNRNLREVIVPSGLKVIPTWL